MSAATVHPNTAHGHSCRGQRSPTYNSWRAMRERCQRAAHPRFEDYGGRGIRVCARWNASFAAFLADMGERPAGTTLDRIDVEGDYRPDNCRWSDAKAQRWNRRDMIADRDPGYRTDLEAKYDELTAGASIDLPF